MEVSVVRIESGNLDILERVDPECFDQPINAERAALCVSSPDAILVVATAAGVVVGQCLGAVHRHPDKATELYIDDLAVAPQWRRQGVAKRLVEACVTIGRAAGAEAVWVATEPSNDEANPFYEALGLARRTAFVFDREIGG